MLAFIVLHAILNNASSFFIIFIYRCFGPPLALHSFPTRRSSDLDRRRFICASLVSRLAEKHPARRPSPRRRDPRDRKSTRLNSSHLVISYAVFCLKKKKKINRQNT